MAAPTGRAVAADRRSGTLTRRLLLWHALAVVGVLLVLGLVVDRVLERRFVEDLTDSLVRQARAVQAALPDGGDLQPDARRLARAIGARVTIIRTDGVVLADSERDPAGIESHRDRPEVIRALGGDVGVATRLSSTVGISFRYVALPPDDGLIVRVAVPLTHVQSELRTLRLIFVVGFGLAALAGVVVVAALAGRLTRPLRDITGAVERVGRGDAATVVPERGTSELVALGRVVNRMREDVAERVRLVEEERRTREAILSALEEGVALFDDGGVRYRNDRAAELLESDPTDLRRLAPPALQRLVRSAEDDGEAGPEEVITGRSSRTLLATAVRMPGEGGVLLVLRDVTEARMVEAVRRDFVGNASHELKTPVASIQALAETIASAASDDPASVARFAGQLEREAVRLSRIVSDLLDLSRLEGEPRAGGAVRLDRIVREESAALRERAERAGLTMTVEANGAVRVNGSERDLRLMIRNLVENAVQYTRGGGRVAVRVESAGGAAVVEVRDTGIGIPERDRSRVFERFYRVDRARSRDTGGTGLGLSIVRHVAENHGGSVRVDSELGRGSTFTVRLPLEP